MIKLFKRILNYFQKRKQLKKKLKNISKNDPFIYK